MDIRALWCALLITLIGPTGSDWLSCGHIKECQCKWSSGKKTASCITAGLTQIPSLESDIQVLDIHGNNISELQQDVFATEGLVNLQRLNLSSTNLRFVHQNSFRQLSILIELDLSKNYLTELSPHTFKGNERLRVLVLNDNPLSKLVAQQFPPLQHLKKLELSRCQLSKVHPFAFVNLRALETVHIQQNLLSYLHRDTFNLPALLTLMLSDNPWYCDCRIREFHEWFINKNIANEEVYCSGPDNKAHTSWLDISGADMVCPPSAITNPSVIRTEAGADISFGCFVRGDPMPEVSWYFHHAQVLNKTYSNSDISVFQYSVGNFNEYIDDFINKSAQWYNVTISNVTSELAGEWTCSAKSTTGESSAYLTLFLPQAVTAATARNAPDYSKFFIAIGAVLAMASTGFIAACVCWKIRRRRVPPSRSFTDQEKKLLDTSLAVSCDRTSVDVGPYGFEMFDRSMSMESEDTQRCLEPVKITIEGPSGAFPPPPAEFAIPAPYGNIFISVHVTGHKEFPDLLGGGSTLPRRSRTCFLRSAYDNMGPRVTATGSSTWSLPGTNGDKTSTGTTTPVPLSTFSTEFTAL